MSENLPELPVAEPAPVAVPGVGAQLRTAREARNWQVADVAQMLKLGARQVEALESGEWSALPGTTFIRGFVRNYARLVNLDSQALMSILDNALEKPTNNLVLPESKPATLQISSAASARKDKLVALSGLALALLAALIYLALPGDLGQLRESLKGWVDALARKEAPAAEPVATEPVLPPGATVQQVINPQADGSPVVVPPTPDQAGGATSQPQAGGKPALRFVVDKDSWIEVRDRTDNVLFSQRCLAGSEQTVDGAGPLSIVVGYAQGVRVFWRGQQLDLAPFARGDVARFVLE